MLTRDMEMGSEQGMYLLERTPIDDSNPLCLVGGGELNVLAGVELCGQYAGTLKAVTCAYGARAPYLVSADGPSESEITTAELISTSIGTLPERIVWPRERTAEGSNTYRELRNIFELAVERGYGSVGIVTVLVHYARSLLMARHHLTNARFAHLTVQCYASEDILLRHNAVPFGPRVCALLSSQAFMRSFFLEQRGVNALLAGTYSA